MRGAVFNIRKIRESITLGLVKVVVGVGDGVGVGVRLGCAWGWVEVGAWGVAK